MPIKFLLTKLKNKKVVNTTTEAAEIVDASIIPKANVRTINNDDFVLFLITTIKCKKVFYSFIFLS